MLITETKFKQLLFIVQKRTIRCNLEIANFWIEVYKRFPGSMLAIRSIIVVFVLFCWKNKVSITLERKRKPDFDSFFFNLKMLKSHNSVEHDLTHVHVHIFRNRKFY